MPQEHTIERAVLVGLNADCFSKEETASEASLEELEALLETAGGLCTAKILQNRHTPDARTLIGAGKAEEIRQLIGADSLGYMEIEKLKDMVGDLKYCDACFTGKYPMKVPEEDISQAFE